MPSGVMRPLGSAGRSAFARCAGASVDAPTRSASARSASSWSSAISASVVIAAARRLPACSACPDRRRRRPGPSRRPAPVRRNPSAARPTDRPHTACARSARGRRRAAAVPAAYSDSRRAAGPGGDPASQQQSLLANRDIAEQQRRRSPAAAGPAPPPRSLPASTARRGAGGAACATAPPAFHAVSAGSTSVAIRPGGWRASLIAAAPSTATSAALREVLTQCDIGGAMPSISAVSGALQAT